MIYANCDSSKCIIEIEAIGNDITLLTDLSLIINTLYNQINQKNPTNGKKFKELLIQGINDGIVFMDDEQLSESQPDDFFQKIIKEIFYDF